MKKAIVLTSVLAAVALAVIYHQINSRIPRLTPEVIAELQETVQRENESAVAKPGPIGRTIQSRNPLRNVYFGDLHVHTSWSFDARLGGNEISPDEAYQFAQGSPLTTLSGEIAQLSVPLDFAAITDHAESYGLFEGCADPDITDEQMKFCDLFENPSLTAFMQLRSQATQRPPKRMDFCGEDGHFCIEHGRTTWQRTQAAADRAYEPGVFTTFYGYEYSPSWPKRGSTHRNVIFRNRTVPGTVVSAFDAPTALDLWERLEATCIGPCQVLTIPHNLNRFYGKAFSRIDEDGGAYTEADWQRRAQLEPVVEIIQAKGASECAVGVGTNDEECGFEQFFPACSEGEHEVCAGPSSYARDGLKLGLELEAELETNPLQIGFVGSTDTHNSNPGDAEEWDYRGKSNFNDASAMKRLTKREFAPEVPLMHNPGGLAAIWAPENTRDALFDALIRKEVYATSGTRIRLRFFGGWGFDESMLGNDRAIEIAYREGIPMGGRLSAPEAADSAPRFYITVLKDPLSTGIHRVQMIKGWRDKGEQKELVQDIACGGNRSPDPTTHECPAPTTSLNLETCEVTGGDDPASVELVWQDEAFRPAQRAFYYVRVLQNPSCRWSSYDAIRLDAEPVDEVPPQIQERAWSSPIWYSPAS